MNRLAITRYSTKGRDHIAWCMLNEKRELLDFQLFEPDEDTLIDRIYIGRVDNIVKNIEAAFVKISDKQTCFLSLKDAKAPIYTKKYSKKDELCIGDEILVQVVKDSVKTKDPVVSTKLSLHGKHCILTTENTTLGISKKIEKECSIRLKALLNDEAAEHNDKGFGILLRTNAQDVSENEVRSDVRTVIDSYNRIIDQAIHHDKFTLEHSNPPGYIQKLKATDLSDCDHIYTDHNDILECIKDELRATDAESKIKCYEDNMVSLNTLYNLNGQIEKLLQNRIWLKSGANIIIEQLETLTVIDINTGKNQAKKSNNFLLVNKEAATEIAKQLKLRNISGMIIIDFINMRSESDNDELIEYLKKELKKDVVPCSFIDITKLGLVELTRKKVRKSLKEII